MSSTNNLEFKPYPYKLPLQGLVVFALCNFLSTLKKNTYELIEKATVGFLIYFCYAKVINYIMMSRCLPNDTILCLGYNYIGT